MTIALGISDLGKRFGGLVAIDGLSLAIDDGESVGLIGPNGAGKTTIIGLIMGELRPDSGRIDLFGKDISPLGVAERIRCGISRTWQIPRPFANLSVIENIRIGSMPDSLRGMIFDRSDPIRERELAMSVGLAKNDLERKASDLAMGDLRKLEMARTLAAGARILLLDEVFAGLTVGEIDHIAAVIQNLRSRGITFLIVSHDLPALAPLIDRAVAIDRGRVIAEGPLDDILDHPDVRDSYLGR
ncbi:ABC transporter ATP-binding protein [Thioalkalivibrio sp. HK1]|uniref:ABC transporter ATP-binding protein n=1 Tax=Thioalkalivibrio sp. HK1 TaxID=1469245 RepID=UPI0005710FBE|nr:ATP-binding cassette domain-containing protein [Thioalkalivibrio sp. HK1]